jgi:hypothetical protein
MFHRPIEMLTVAMCVVWQKVSFPANRTLCNVPSPDGTLRAPLFGSQGGGVYVASNGVANFEGCNIHDNTASDVCSPSALALNLHSSPPWTDPCTDRLLCACSCFCVAGCECSHFEPSAAFPPSPPCIDSFIIDCCSRAQFWRCRAQTFIQAARYRSSQATSERAWS